MSFRGKLGIFFFLVVVVPIVSVAFVLFNLVEDNETGKADARLASNQAVAVNLTRDLRVEADRIAEQGISLAAPGVDARIRVMFDPTLDPINTMIPGLIASIMMISLMTIMSQAVVKERESGTLEQMFVTPIKATEYLIGKLQGIAVIEIYLELGGPAFMGKGIDIQFLGFAVIEDVLDDGIEVIGGIDAVGQMAVVGGVERPL